MDPKEKSLTLEDEVRLLRGTVQDLSARLRKTEKIVEKLTQIAKGVDTWISMISPWTYSVNDELLRLAKKVNGDYREKDD